MAGGMPAGQAGAPTLCQKVSSTQDSVNPGPAVSECQGDMINPLAPPLGKTFWKLLGFGEQLELLEVLWAGGPLLSGFGSQCVANLPVTLGETELFWGRGREMFHVENA